MFVAVVLVFLLVQTSAESDKVRYRCSGSSNNDTSMTFDRTQDGVNGRYTAELCTLKNPNWTDWTIDLTYYDNLKYCGGYGWLRRPGKQHSTNTLDINDTTNCTHMCYGMNFDLIFSGCYGVKSTFRKGKISSAPHDSYHIINNNLTKTYFSENKPHVNFVNHEDEVSLYWYLGIPPTEFRVEMCRKQNTTMECIKTEDVTRNCTVHNVKEVHCFLSPPYDCYRALLTHEAPWTSGVFNGQTYVYYDFCHRVAAVPQVSWSGAQVWRWCGVGAGAVSLAAAALLAAAPLRRALRTRNYHKHVLDSWRRIRSSEVETAPVVELGSRPVLLLYAREGELGQRAVAALKALVQNATGGPVYDIFSAEVTALSAAAPAGWLRAVLARDDVRVLLLQTPAAAALYHAQLLPPTPTPTPTHGFKLQEPLLGRRAQYRSPQFGDALLQLSLRLLAETPHNHHAYHKYYFATFSGLQTDIVPHVVPYRRYELPAAATALLADLAGPPAPRPAGPPAPPPAGPPALSDLSALSAAAQEFLLHVQRQPDYLMDELIIM